MLKAAIAFLLATSPALAQQAPLLAPGIEAFPKLPGTTAAENTINADLARRDAEALALIQSCLARDGSDWLRWTLTPFPGPRYLSLLVTDDFYCQGAAHPNQFIQPLTYDLVTGQPINWPALLPPSLTTPSYPDSPFPQDSFSSAALTQLYLSHYPRPAGDDCTNVVLRQNLTFRFWLDAAEQALMLLPDNFSHAERACADAVAIPATELAALGASATLTEALSPP